MPNRSRPRGLLRATVPCATSPPGDRAAVRTLTAATGFFSAEEVAVAVELVEARLAQGLASGYRFLFADGDGTAGRLHLLRPDRAHGSSFDLYWIAVAARRRSGRASAAG